MATVYRHARSDAAAAASAQDWFECERLLHIARCIEQNYPSVTARARFPQAVELSHGAEGPALER